MAMVSVAVFGLLGCIVVGFALSWKLTLLNLCVTMPIVTAANFICGRYEAQYEQMNRATFSESSKFAAESTGTFRTVSSLTLECINCRRCEFLLQDHVKAASSKAKFSVLVFAAGNTIPFLCMALTFWYGGRLLASKEYRPFNFFAVYVALTNGAEAAGKLLSFGPGNNNILGCSKTTILSLLER